MIKINEKKVLPHEFYNRNPETVAKELLGKYLVRRIRDSNLIGKITEVEAYLDSTDPAAHSFIGERPRTKSLFGRAGFTYVFTIHRQFCLNFSTEEVGKGSGVLIRAIEPIEGLELMEANRPNVDLKNLTNGPGKLCQALKITRNKDGIDATNFSSEIFVIESNEKPQIASSKRIGISKAKDLELRFYIKDSQFILK